MPKWTVNLDGGPRRVNHAAVILGSKIYSFGGYCSGEKQDQNKIIDVHVLDTANYRWSKVNNSELPCSNRSENVTANSAQMENQEGVIFLPMEARENSKPAGENVPYQRYGHTVVEYQNRAYLWGGRNDDFGASNVLHEFDPSTARWRKITVDGFVPAARDGHSAIVFENKMFVFGGFEEDAQRFSQETYVYNFDENKWSQLHTKNTPPIWRDFHTAVVIGHNMYVFGGRSDQNGQVGDDHLFHSSRDVYDDSLMALDLITGYWSKVEVGGTPPGGRRSHSAWVYKNKMYMFGGYLSSRNVHYNELYCFDPETRNWSVVEVSGKYPSARRRHCTVVVGDRVFLFGGSSPNPKNRTSMRFLDGMSTMTSGLVDLSDLHVLDYSPSLAHLATLEILKKNLPSDNIYDCLKSELPFNIRLDMYCMTLPNRLSSYAHNRSEMTG